MDELSDFYKCKSVIDDALRGNSSIAVRCISGILNALMLQHGSQFTIDGAVRALEDISKYAQVFKEELTKDR